MRTAVVVMVMRHAEIMLGYVDDDVVRFVRERPDRRSNGLPRQHDHQQDQEKTAHGNGRRKELADFSMRIFAMRVRL